MTTVVGERGRVTAEFIGIGVALLALGAVAFARGEESGEARAVLMRPLNGVPVPDFATTSLGPAEFQALHAAVAPRGQGERWTQIPWEPDLEAARQRAFRERKPLLMWIMDGHPLGCT